jgi:hypothetical protein
LGVFKRERGARIVTARRAARELALARGFTPETWREEFRQAATDGKELINGKKCYRVRLTRADDSKLTRFFDEQSGLLAREISSEFDEAGVEHDVMLDVDAYKSWGSVRYPSSVHVRSEGHNRSIKVESVSYTPYVPEDAFVIPHEVIRAIADGQNAGQRLPSAVALVDRFIEVTGGGDAQEGIRTETMKGEVTFGDLGVKAQLIVYAAKGGKQYISFDLPGAGKFELGSDGVTGWERSVMLGPRLLPRSQVAGSFLGADREQVLRWTTAFEKLETLSKEDVNGSPCYLVRIQSQEGDQPATACFDVNTGYLVRITTRVKSEAGEASFDCILSDYRADGPVKNAHHVQTTLGGQPVGIELTEVGVNGRVPDKIFDLPEDVRALKEKRSADADATGNGEDQPSLRRRK